jgi:hypothetical protein
MEEKRQRILTRIEKFHQTADTMTDGVDHGAPATAPADNQAFTMNEGALDWSEAVATGAVDFQAPENAGIIELAEHLAIWMPSSIDREKAKELGLEKMLDDELELRIGQANDALEDLRVALGEKAVLYRKTLRSANSVVTGTRSKKLIEQVNSRMNKHVRRYLRARKVIHKLSTDPATLAKYKDIAVTDLSVNKDVTEENRFGQGSDKLAWFWAMGRPDELGHDDAWMNECQSLVFNKFHFQKWLIQ